MFLARATIEVGELLIIGLSRANRERLEAGQPIDLSQDTHGLTVPAGLRIMIFAGETEAEMEQQMATLIGPSTVRDQRRPN
jgi:hypothetical protein